MKVFFARLCLLADQLSWAMHQNDHRAAHIVQAGGIFLLYNASQGNAFPVSFRGKFYFVNFTLLPLENYMILSIKEEQDYDQTSALIF